MHEQTRSFGWCRSEYGWEAGGEQRTKTQKWRRRSLVNGVWMLAATKIWVVDYSVRRQSGAWGAGAVRRAFCNRTGAKAEEKTKQKELEMSRLINLLKNAPYMMWRQM